MPSMTEHWTLASSSFCQDNLQQLQEHLGISLQLAKLLQVMGIHELAKAKDFLYPKLAQLEDPFEITHLKAAAQRLLKALQHKETIYLVGDYDVDGVTSTVLFVSLLSQLKQPAKYFIPRRMDEGYGLSQAAIERILGEGKPDLLCVLDSGTNAHQEVAFLKEKGIDVMILDHHQPKGQLPDCIIVNPHVYDAATKPWKDMCTVGLVFKLMHALLKLLKEIDPDSIQSIRLSDHLDLVALGTVADLMPLSHENRILVKQGLKRLQTPSRPGLQALYKVSDIDGPPVQPLDISFKLGPRINASGRLADAALPVDMLLSEDPTHCLELAQELDAMNRERQEIEKLIFQEAQAMVEIDFKHDPGLILHHEQWHSGVVGIVAGRLARQYKRPCIVLGKEGAYAKGSGRSAGGINLIDALKPSANLLKSFGGHPMAVGLSLDPVHLKDLRILFNTALLQAHNAAEIKPEIKIALQLKAQDIGSHFLNELLLLHPYGEGNTEPIFAIERALLTKKPEVFGEGHYRFSLKVAKGEWAYGVAWKQAHTMAPAHIPIDLAVKIAWNHWNKRKTIQLELISWRLSS